MAGAANGLTVTNMAAGGYHTLIVKSDGSIWVCGRYEEGQLGIVTNQNIPIQTKLASPTNVTAVAGGTLHSLALLSDGTVQA